MAGEEEVDQGKRTLLQMLTGSALAVPLAKTGVSSAVAVPENAAPKAVRLLSSVDIAGIPYHAGTDHIAGLPDGMELMLKREPNNPHDPRAIAVCDPDGTRLGYVPARMNRIPATLMDAGDQLKARLRARRSTMVMAVPVEETASFDAEWREIAPLAKGHVFMRAGMPHRYILAEQMLKGFFDIWRCDALPPLEAPREPEWRQLAKHADIRGMPGFAQLFFGHEMKVGDKLQLSRVRDNPDFPYSVRVQTVRGNAVGYLDWKTTEAVAPVMDTGGLVRAVVDREGRLRGYTPSLEKQIALTGKTDWWRAGEAQIMPLMSSLQYGDAPQAVLQVKATCDWLTLEIARAELEVRAREKSHFAGFSSQNTHP